MSNFNFSFGSPVAFTGLPTPAEDGVLEQLRVAQVAICKLEGDLGSARAGLAAARAEVTSALVAKKTAEDKEQVARACFKALHDNRTTMDDYDRVVKLEGELQSLRQDQSADREEISSLARTIVKKDQQLTRLDNQLTSLSGDNAAQRKSLADTKQDLADQKQAYDELGSTLDKANETLRDKQDKLDALSKAKADAEQLAKAREQEIDDLHAQLQQSQEKIDQLEDAVTDVEQLEHHIEQLQTDFENQQINLGDRDRTIQVKDARIQHLETQYQKALDGKLKAEEAVAENSSAPTDTPTVFNSTDASLQDELDAASDYSETPSIQQLDFSDITEIADITPSAPTLNVSAIQATSIAPVAQQTSTSFTQTDVSSGTATATQTDTPKVNHDIVQSVAADISPVEIAKASNSTMSTQTVTAELNHGITHSVTADISPVEFAEASNSVMSTQTDDVIILAERKSQTAAAQTDISNPPPPFVEHEKSSVDTQTSPIVEKIPETRIVHTVAPASKKGLFSSRMHALISAITILMCLYLFALLQVHKTANGYYGRNPYSSGAFGQGRYLFGVIPVGFDIGPDWLSEQICSTTSTAIKTFEEWAGITPTPLY